MESAMKQSVLVVDDEIHNINVLSRMLSPLYTVRTAKNGEAAITVAEKYVPDLILLDVLMPDMSGFEVFEILRASDVAKNIPVIFITGLDSSKDEEKGLMLGAVDYITKPFVDSTVLARIETHLKIVRQINDIEQLRIKADHAAKAKSEFLASMSHEIRTPMNAIIGMAELLLREQLTPKQYTYANDIKTSSTALLGIINDILDSSKIEAGKLNLIPVHYKFSQLIDNIASIIRFSAKKRALEFQVEKRNDLPAFLYGDDVRLRQVLLNILSNAVKFTDKGYVRLTIERAGDSIFFYIKDSGIGIREADIERLFDAFEQADSYKNRNIQGTGLGLSITKALVEMMDGSIEVKSIYGSGTTFIVRIPFVPGDEKQIQNDVDNLTFISAPTADVLLVDDTKANITVGIGLFQLCGIKCDTAANGREAVEKVRTKKYDIVFMDHLMPIMDGVEATKAIRALGKEYAELPIIALTANAMEGVRDKLIEAGMNDFLTKPIVLPLLNAALKRWLPAEKQIAAANPDETKPKDEIVYRPVIEQVGNIKGIDLSAGIKFVGGVQDAYEQALKSLCRDIFASHEELPDFLDNDTNTFIIRIHGLGSSLALVGHAILSKAAKDMENASKNADLQFCKEHLPGFLEDLVLFGNKLKDIFEEDEAKNSASKKSGNKATLKESLDCISAALDNFDLDIVKRETDRILCFTYGGSLDDAVKRLGEAVEEYDYTLADEVTNELAVMLS